MKTYFSNAQSKFFLDNNRLIAAIAVGIGYLIFAISSTIYLLQYEW